MTNTSLMDGTRMATRGSRGRSWENSIAPGSSVPFSDRSATCRAQARARNSIARNTSNKTSPAVCSHRRNGALRGLTLCARLLHSFQSFRYFIDAWYNRDLVVFVPCQLSLAVNDRNGASRDAFVLEENAVFLGNGAARLKIGQQRVVDTHFFSVRFVRPDTVDA